MKELYIRYKRFEIRRPNYDDITPEEHKNDWEIIKWSNNFESCWSIGFLRWNPKESCYKFESVGMRLFEYMEDGLPEFIIHWVDFQEFILNNI